MLIYVLFALIVHLLSLELLSSVVEVTWFVARSLRYSVLVLVAIALNLSALWAAFSAFITKQMKKKMTPFTVL